MNPIKDREETIDRLIQRQSGICPICQILLYKEFTPSLRLIEEFIGLSDADIINYLKVDLHHRMPDNKVNTKRYPNFIRSDYNLYALHHKCHMDNKFYGWIGDKEAAEYEKKIKSGEM